MLVFLWSERIPEDGTPVPKYMRLIYVIICILLSTCVGIYIDQNRALLVAAVRRATLHTNPGNGYGNYF